ncbi:MAG: radical SAM protein [Patescibacteria group bacterium]
MKIQLIHPPADSTYGKREVTYLRSFPVGLEIIAKAIENSNPGAKVEILDGNFLDVAAIKSKIDADIVGVSDWYSKHRNALNILEFAKTKNSNCQTVMGGPNATNLGSRIMKNHAFVDFVIAGEGEETLAQLVAGQDPVSIPNLFYRDNGEIRFTYSKKAEINILFDLEHVDREKYLFSQSPLPISLIRGCIKAAQSTRCTFCSIPCQGVSLMKPELAWQQIGLLNKKYGVDYVWETGDSFMVGNYPQQLLNSRPKELECVSFRIFASPDQINQENADLLHKLNVQEMFLGVETINTDLLRRAKKSYSREQIIDALKILGGYDIRIQIPIMYGLPGETPETAEENYLFAQQIIKDFPNIYAILTSFPIPLIGSELFENLVKNRDVIKDYPGDLLHDDIIDYENLAQLQVKYFTTCLFDQLSSYISKTASLIKERSGGFDLTK